MWRSIEDSSEQPQEMITRQARLARDLIQIQGKVITVVDELTGARQPSIGIGVRGLQFDYGGFCVHRIPGS